MTLAREGEVPVGTDPAERGTLEIGDTVVRKIVEYATDQVHGVLRGARRVAGLSVGQTGSSARVAVGDELVDIRLEVAVRYPGSVPALVSRVREHLAGELGRITGHHIRTFDVVVSGLLHEPTSRPL